MNPPPENPAPAPADDRVALFRGVNGEQLRVTLGGAPLERAQEVIFRTHPGAEFLGMESNAEPTPRPADEPTPTPAPRRSYPPVGSAEMQAMERAVLMMVGGESPLHYCLKSLLTLILALSVPAKILYGTGTLTAVIWLAILGEWRALILGGIASVGGGVLLGVAMMAGFPFAWAEEWCAKAGQRGGASFFGLLGFLYVGAVITAWCMAALYFYGRMTDETTAAPLLLWSYGVALAPLHFIAAKEEQGGKGDTVLLVALLASIGHSVAVLATLFGEATLSQCIITFSSIMGAGMLLAFAVTKFCLRPGEQIFDLYPRR